MHHFYFIKISKSEIRLFQSILSTRTIRTKKNESLLLFFCSLGWGRKKNISLSAYFLDNYVITIDILCCLCYTHNYT